ncbi:restriction endonuclease subunit S [Vibrio sp. 10N.247.311.14]|uniref:restriction endonuclease subunit S n=1 Tax=unclassified Vibrio TaxID=2614977 RepID=UPI00354FCDF4
MRKYNTYLEYRSWENNWIRELPESWQIVPLKYLCTNFVKDGPHETPKFLDSGIPFLSVDGIQDNKLVFEGCRYISREDHKRYSMKCLPKKGDVLLGKAASVGKVAYVDTDMSFNVWSPLAVITAKSNHLGRYIYYCLQSKMLQAQCEVFSNSNTQKNLGMSTIDNLDFPYPSEFEAKCIAKFLDHETAKIDTLIAKQQQLIKLLKEKRQAVISHAVTKGLKPDTPMKDSGVEWLGEVPEHWVVTRAKYVSNIFVPQRNKPELNDTHGIAWATMEDMKQQYISDTSKYVSSESALAAGSKKLKAGSVIASCVGNFGVTSINKIDVIINQQLQAFQPINIKAEYLQSIVALSKQYFELIGTAATLVYVNQEGFENLPILMPPEKEQNEICEYVLGKSTSFDLLIEKSVIQTSLLKERRTALISAAVTGKIDVRNWQAPVNQDAQQQEAG